MGNDSKSTGGKGSTSKPLPREERESLGWLAQSAVQPKKRTEIEGVSASSIVDLKAQLYRTQEESRLRAEGVLGPNDSTTRRKAGLDVTRFNRKNAGVDERNRQDEVSVQRAKDRVSECYAALERKAKLYEQLVRGEAPDDDENYNVDFLQKQHTLDDEAKMLGEPSREQPTAELGEVNAAAGYAAAFEAEMTACPRESDGCPPGWAPAMDRPGVDTEHEERTPEELLQLQNERQERIRAIRAQAQETESGRTKAEGLKQRRAQAQADKRERLKQEFLRKKVAALMAEKQQQKAAGAKRKADQPLHK